MSSDLKFSLKSNKASFVLLMYFFFLGQFYLFFQNKCFQMNIRNIIPSSNTYHWNSDWNCGKCIDSCRENGPFCKARSSTWSSGSFRWQQFLLSLEPPHGCWWERRDMINGKGQPPPESGLTVPVLALHEPRQLWAGLLACRTSA